MAVSRSKQEFVLLTGISSEDILSEIYRIFCEIPKERLVPLQSNWIARLEWTIEHHGERSHGESKAIRSLFH
jgi:hypothetical protein